MDIYGHEINLTYKGDSKYKTMPGAIASIIVLCGIASYFLFRTYVVFNRGNTNVLQSKNVLNMEAQSVYNPMQRGFDFAFGLGIELDPTVFNYTV